MFPFNIGFSLDLIAITGATALYAWSTRNRGAGSAFARLVSVLVIIFALISIICTAYTGMKIWGGAYGPPGMDRGMMMDGRMDRDLGPRMDNEMSTPREPRRKP